MCSDSFNHSLLIYFLLLIKINANEIELLNILDQ